MMYLNCCYSYPPNPFRNHGPYKVYLFVLLNGMYYVGFLKGNPWGRWRKDYNPELTKAIKDMGGIENVPKFILRSGLSKSEAAFFERLFSVVYHSRWPNGYNKKPCGLGERIAQIDKETFDILRVWPSMHYAAKKLKISHGDISEAANGKRKSAGGFYWCFVDRPWMSYGYIAQEGGKPIDKEEISC